MTGHPFQRGIPVVFREDGLKEYAGLTGRVAHFHGDPGYDNADHANDEVWVEFDKPALNKHTKRPVGEGVWVNIQYINASHDGNLDIGGSATVEYLPHVPDHPILISGGHASYELDAVFLDVKQALSLLEWLKQYEPMLKQKAHTQQQVDT